MKKPNWKKYCITQFPRVIFDTHKRGNRWYIFIRPNNYYIRDRIGSGETKAEAWKSASKRISDIRKRRPPPPPPPK
jgi:hypothetical protein